uniref:Uncharacterized protein n=1 Tax=Arundo donax TaxID=35708 RepID=A0A0A9FZS5_ARUDO
MQAARTHMARWPAPHVAIVADLVAVDNHRAGAVQEQ